MGDEVESGGVGVGGDGSGSTEMSDTYQAAGCPSTPGVFATFFVFLDLPKHVEFRVQDMPLLDVGTVVDFDLTIKSTRKPNRTIRVQGKYEIRRRVLKYGGKRPGMTQFIEWELSRSKGVSQ